MIKFRQKNYTRYDETDSLKRMKDSDILAQKKRSNGGLWGQNAYDTAVGAGLGAGAGALVGALGRGKGTSIGSAMKKGGKYGAILGGGVALGASLLQTRDKKQDNNFYNERLEYAQRHAKRRERADWSNNNNNREGYTY